MEVKLKYDYMKLETIKNGSEVLKENEIEIQELRSKLGDLLGISNLCSVVKKQKYGPYFKCVYFCLRLEACGREWLVSGKG